MVFELLIVLKKVTALRELFLPSYLHLTKPYFEEFEVDDAGLLDYEGVWKTQTKDMIGQLDNQV